MGFEWHDPLDKNFYTVLIDNCGKFYARVVRFTKDNKVIYDHLIEVCMPFLTDEMTENFKNRLEKSICSTMNSSFSNTSTIVENRSKYLYFITNDIIPGEISKIKEYKSSSTKLLGQLTISYDFGHSSVYIEYEDKGYSYKADILELDKTLTMFEILPEKEEKENMEIEFKNGNSIKITTENDTGLPIFDNKLGTYPKFTNSDRLIPLTDILPFTGGKPAYSLMAQGYIVKALFLEKFNFEIKKVVFNGPVTNITWADGTTTVVKKAEGDPDDKETAIAYAYLKRLYSLIGIKDMDKHLSKLVKEGKDNEASIKEKREKRAKKKALAKKKAAAKTETKKPTKPKKENK